MAIEFDVTGPDDLPRLTSHCDNLRIDTSQPEDPVLVVDNKDHPAFLTVVFPPKSIAETAFFVTEPMPTARNVKARIVHPTRLVFKVPPPERIPFTVAGVLDWSGLELFVSPIPAIPPTPRQAQIEAAAIAPPQATETALEIPYRLIVLPNAVVRWTHRLLSFGSRGRTELWHTRLQISTPHGPVELTEAPPAPLRAIFSADYNTVHPPAPSLDDPNLGPTAMAPNDRHQIVILTSAFHWLRSRRRTSLSKSAIGF
jgi:hypothetical protein